jgi:formyltetrahydrofolate deformylase
MESEANNFALLFSCEDRPGIVSAVSGLLFEQGCNIIEAAQFGDEGGMRFFMRVEFSAPASTEVATLQSAFAPIGSMWHFDWQIFDLAQRQRAIIMVSQGGHCLNDLLYRTSSGRIPMTIAAVVSNHEKWRGRVEHEGLPFHYLPVNPDNKAEQETNLLALIERENADLVILARYMQVLSEDICRKFPGRIINIHHSFLPGFKGARPYHRAHDRGVKMVGATAHYVTSDLDEGPIITQDVAVVDHADSVDDLIAVGQDTESTVLARAVNAHVEHRIILNGNRTVVFR